MRNAFAEELVKVGEKEERLLMLAGDIGNRLFDPFKEKFPKRFFNCGIAEANMISVAAGLASEGFIPIVYTITPFVTVRCLEQIRVDVCYHNVPVVIVGTGSGLSYSNNGPTHHSLEDIAMLRAIPGLQILCPGDAYEVRELLWRAVESERPTYIRLGKKGEPKIHESRPTLSIGKAFTLSEGKDICILNTGNMLGPSVEVVKKLKETGISVQLENFHTVKPLDETKLEEVFKKFSLVVTIEEHSRLGGFGSAVSEWASSKANLKARQLTIGTEDVFLHEGGEQHHARALMGISPEKIVQKICAALEAVKEKRDF